MKFIFSLILLLLSAPVVAEDLELVTLSPHWEGLRKELSNAFNEYRSTLGKPAVKFKFLDVGGTSNIVRYIESSFKANPEFIGVDLFWGGSVDAHQELKRQGFLARLSDSIASANGIPGKLFGIELFDPDGYWFGSMLGGFGIFCNLDVLKRLGLEQPTSWKDLTRVEYKDWLAAANPVNSGSAHMAYEIILQKYGWNEGWRILESIAKNVRVFSSYAAEIPQIVAAGEVACGFSTDSIAWQQISILGREHARFILPEDAYCMSPDPIAVIRGSLNIELAREFIEFLLSEKAQVLMMRKAGTIGGPKKFSLARYPIRPEIYSLRNDDDLIDNDPFIEPNDFKYDNDIGARRWQVVNDLFLLSILERHTHLKQFDSTLSAANLLPEGALLAFLSDTKEIKDRVRTLNDWRKMRDQSSSVSISFISVFPFLVAVLLLFYLCGKIILRR
jgi:ABC-type Fe3+ transport system substrate-binding protein